MTERLIMGALITAIVFGGIPIALALFGRISAATGLGLRPPHLLAILGGAILGAALWPSAHESFLLSNWLGLSSLSDKRIKAASEMLEQLQALPWWLVVATLGIVPAIFEELTFRGFLFSSLRTRLAGWPTIIVSALLFGVFHEILSPGRLFPSTFLGLVLGWVRFQTGSVWACMLLHAINNSLLLTISHHRDDLVARGIGAEQQAHLPLKWHALALLGVAIGIGLVRMASRNAKNELNHKEHEGHEVPVQPL